MLASADVMGEPWEATRRTGIVKSGDYKDVDGIFQPLE